MAKEFAKKFYKSKAWRKCREAYISSVYGLCERCGHVGDILHHKILLTPDNINNPNVTLAFENLEFLCIECHNKEHMELYTNTSYETKFDSEGNLVKKPPRGSNYD